MDIILTQINFNFDYNSNKTAFLWIVSKKSKQLTAGV